MAMKFKHERTHAFNKDKVTYQKLQKLHQHNGSQWEDFLNDETWLMNELALLFEVLWFFTMFAD